jgi:hypothetical protein
MAYCDSAWISIYPSGNVTAWGYNWPHPNTIVMVDDLQWGYLTVGINESSLSVEKIYPNPAKNIINVVYTVPKKYTVSVRIFDSKGNLMETVINNESQSHGRYKAEADVSCLAKGVYFIEVTNGDEIKSEKIIIE